jgi:hypothetical protein
MQAINNGEQLANIKPSLDESVGATVQEVHIDFLLEEEFSVDPSFLRKFTEAAGQQGTPSQAERVERSVTDRSGEADLIVVYKPLEGDGEKVAILIEDKIRAGFQPRQADRYRERGEAGKGKEWDKYWTCLVAPSSYLKPRHGFDAAVTLEQIREWLALAEPKRHAFKALVIDQAIEKAQRVGVQKVDPVMTAFRERYYAAFEESFADQRQAVHMRPPAPTWWGDSWFEIRSTLLPDGAYINHKSQSGCVDLTFPNTNATLLDDIDLFLEEGMTVEQTGKSAAIRLRISKIVEFTDFDGERAKVNEALAAAKRLLAFHIRERVRLESALKIAKTVAV